MIPGSASGSTSRNDTVSRPKKRNRCTAKAAALPSTSATPVAPNPTLTDSTNASRTSWLRHAVPNHFVEKCVIGHAGIRDWLNA